MVPPLRDPTRHKTARQKKSGRSGRDDKHGTDERAAQLEGVGADFGVFGGPVVGREGDAPEFGGGLQEFDADFGFVFSGRGDVDDADELFLEGIWIAAKNFLADFDTRGYLDQGTVGADVHSEGVFGDVLTIGTSGNDEDGETEQDALGAAAVRNGGVVGGGSGHGGDGLRVVLEKKRGRSRGGKY